LVWLLISLRLRYMSARIRERSEERANEQTQRATAHRGAALRTKLTRQTTL
jgi:hypothetical protein